MVVFGLLADVRYSPLAIAEPTSPGVGFVLLASQYSSERLSKLWRGTYRGTDMKLKDERGERSYRNWMGLPPLIRRDSLQDLTAAISTEVFSKWLTEYRARGTVGEDDPLFHFGTGMAVRNILRQRLPESELSQITGIEHSDWDDFYIGAMRELLDTAPCSLTQTGAIG